MSTRKGPETRKNMAYLRKAGGSLRLEHKMQRRMARDEARSLSKGLDYRWLYESDEGTLNVIPRGIGNSEGL